MKARVKATGEIVEVIAISDYINENGQIIGEYKDGNGMLYTSYDLDFYIEEDITIPDYWTRLEHQYAGMAMQVLMTDPALINIYREDGKIAMKSFVEAAVDICYDFSHALIQKLKEKEER